MGKIDYTYLDTLILASVIVGNDKFSLIFSGDVRREAESLAGKTGEPFRFVDRRLQALRRVGKLAFRNNKWIAA